MPWSASSVVAHSCRAAVRSKDGPGDAGPFLLILPVPAWRLLVDEDGEVEGSAPGSLDDDDVGFRLPCESTEVRGA
jgi:hypothetical protein